MIYRFLGISLILLLAACNDRGSSGASSDTDSLTKKDSVPATPETTIQLKPAGMDSSALLKASYDILTAIKAKDYNRVASFIDPLLGVRLSPAAYVDTTVSKPLQADRFIQLSQDKTKHKWGVQQGETGNEVLMTFSEYFSKHVYSADFLTAPRHGVDMRIGNGNGLNNLRDIYRGKDFHFTEFHFPGFDSKYSGMDWQSLRLVFRMEMAVPKLVCIVHDQWEI